MSTVINFYKNDSAQWQYTGTSSLTLYMPNGIVVRKTTDFPNEVVSTITVAHDETLIFQRVDSEISRAFVVSFGVILLELVFDNKNNYIITEDFCYKDFYRHNGNVKNVYVFSKDAAGTYMYDEDNASFILWDGDASKQRYSDTRIDTPIQDKGELFDAFIESGDIIFADFTTGDAAIEMWINATVSVAGLKMTWSSDTNTDFQETNTPIKLGNIENTGSFDNDEVRYSGSRCIVSKKIEPDSRHGIAIRYKIIADLINNGYDDIEIHDMNLLTQMKLYEVGGDDA
ncbi:MAG TPA: hypothetical protein PLZ43_09200 [bacterium]|nr:hypothetical protein [bacterium]